MQQTSLRRRRLDWNEVVLEIWWDDADVGKECIDVIRRKKVNGVWVYILLDIRDWYVSTYESLREAWGRADDWGFRSYQPERTN